LKTHKTFKTLEEVKTYLANEEKSIWLGKILAQKQIVICQKTDRWKIVEIINPE
jgi:hypothetical protein